MTILAEPYTGADDPEIVTVPSARFISILGQGAPGTAAFYATKALVLAAAEELRQNLGLAGAEEAPAPLEVLYWHQHTAIRPGIADFYTAVPLEAHLHYRMLVRVPENVTRADIDRAYQALPAADRDRSGGGADLFTLDEGQSVQVTHRGPFVNESATLERLDAFASSHGLSRRGPHHEIHLDSFEPDTPQDSLRTIIRVPVTEVDPTRA